MSSWTWNAYLGCMSSLSNKRARGELRETRPRSLITFPTCSLRVTFAFFGTVDGLWTIAKRRLRGFTVVGSMAEENNNNRNRRRKKNTRRTHIKWENTTTTTTPYQPSHHIKYILNVWFWLASSLLFHGFGSLSRTADLLSLLMFLCF